MVRASDALSAGAAPAAARAEPAGRGIGAHWLIILASLLFATMGVCVKLASSQYASGEIVLYRSVFGATMMAVIARWRGGTVLTKVPAMHFWRSLAGVISLCLWFYALGHLPLATAMTLNYLSSVWMALFLVGGAIALGASRVDGRLILTVLVGFAGVFLILRPTIGQDQLWYGLVALLSGVIAATAYLQLAGLGRIGEPDYRIVFWFSIGGVIAGLGLVAWTGLHAHTLRGIALLLGVGLFASVAQLLMTLAYSRGQTLVNASLQYLGIAWSFLYGVTLFHDPVTWQAIAGMILIAGAGLSATMLRSRGPAKELADTPDTL